VSSNRAYYLTTPIYYVNDVPHVGHAYTTIAADVVTRARRLRGVDAFLLTGTDEHGQNIERIAREKGISEQEHCDRIAARFKELWVRYEIHYDRFIRTTDDVHKRGVIALWERLRQAQGPDGKPVIYRGKYAGWYCSRCEAFKTEDELKQPGNVCPDHELPCEWTEEENFFFRLSAYGPWLGDEIGSGRIRIDPVGRRNEVLAVVKQGLQDFSVSRARVKWGIPVPEEPAHVFYVWMDALANYVTALGFADGDDLFDRYWTKAEERFHLVGKEIIRFHCLYWPAMLRAAGLAVPTRVFAHGHLTKNGKKLSKTTGNVIDPEALIAEWGADAVRYFLLREGSFGQDWDFTDRALLGRYNSDLANDLGNLVSRALTMVGRYCDGKIPPRPEFAVASTAGVGPASPQDFTGALQDQIQTGWARKVLERYDEMEFVGALGDIWSAIGSLNQAIAVVKPWELAKDPKRRKELDGFLYRLLQGIRVIAVLVSPVMPSAADRIFKMLGIPARLAPADLGWDVLVPGASLGTIEPLFPRVDVNPTVPNKETTPVSDTPVPPASTPSPAPTAPPAAAPTVPAAAPANDKIDIADFGKVELRAARVLEAEKIAGSKKLLRLQVDLGDEKRQVVAGISESYAPEDMVGRTVIVVANLKPAKLMGHESNGMVLAGSIDGKAVLCSFAGEVAPGTKVK
jgi:methionyl-tRNA synthetase